MTESAEPIVSETRTAVTKLTQDVDSFKATVSETYTEKSNFNEFRQKAENDLTANSTAIEQRYTEIKAVEQQVLGVDGKVTDVQKRSRRRRAISVPARWQRMNPGIPSTA